MARGGIYQRHRLSEASAKPSYRLNGVQAGSIIAECLDKYRRWELGYRTGELRSGRTRDYLYVYWHDTQEIERYNQADARYKVDTNLWRITGPSSRNVMDILSGALTSRPETASISISPPTHDEGNEGPEEMQSMAQDKPEAEGDKTFVSKQVARRLGTDGRKFRQFLRATGQGVGQGGRYEFTEAEVQKLEKDWKKWIAGKGTKAKADNSEPEKLGLNDGEDKPARKRSTPKVKKGDAREFPSDERTDEEIEEAFLAEQAGLEADDEEELDLELDDEEVLDLDGLEDDDAEELDM